MSYTVDDCPTSFICHFFCPIVNIATYTSVNIIFVYVPAIYIPYKVVTKFRFQCFIFLLWLHALSCFVSSIVS